MIFEDVGPSEELPGSCASIDPELDDVHKFHSTDLFGLTWIWHPDMSTQKLGFQRTLQLLEVIKTVITEMVVGALCDTVCIIMHWTLAPALPSLHFFAVGVSQVL